MRSLVWLAGCVCLLAGCSHAIADQEKEVKEDKFDATKLVGTWTFVSGEKDGQKLDKDHLKNQKLVITKDAFTLKGEATFVMKYELDPKKKPIALKLTMTESPFGAGATA